MLEYERINEEIPLEVDHSNMLSHDDYPYGYGMMNEKNQISSLAIIANPKIVAATGYKLTDGSLRAVVLWKNDLPYTADIGYAKIRARKSGSTSYAESRLCVSSGIPFLHRKNTIYMSEKDPLATTVDVYLDKCNSTVQQNCYALYPYNWGLGSIEGSPQGITSIDTIEKYSGANSAKIVVPGTVNQNSPSIGSSSMVVIPNTVHTLKSRGKVLGTGGGRPAVRLVEFRTSLNNYDWNNQRSIYWDTIDTIWTQKTLSFTTFSDTTKVYIYGNIYGGYGTFNFDDVELIQDGTTNNLVLNPGFELTYTTPICTSRVQTDSRVAVPLVAYNSTAPSTPTLTISTISPGSKAMTISIGSVGVIPVSSYYIRIFSPISDISGYIPYTGTIMTLQVPDLVANTSYAVFVQAISPSDVWSGSRIMTTYVPGPAPASPALVGGVGILAGAILVGMIRSKKV